MKSITFLAFIFFVGASFTTEIVEKPPHIPSDYFSLSESNCTSSFGGDVKVYKLRDGFKDVGHSIWISRESGRAKAKYFAHKLGNQLPHHRYTMWRVNGDREVILKSSGAYATGWGGYDKPVGVTVDNGVIVNENYDSRMDGLVIVYATGGIAISNIEDGDLYLQSLGRKIDIRNQYDLQQFLQWAKKEDATVFQMHLMAYKNDLKAGRNGSKSSARRKFLVLAKDGGELFHSIFYFKNKSYTLYESSNSLLNYLKGRGMDVIAMINLDTGGFDILNTGGGATDCSSKNVFGTCSNYDNMTNLLTYEFE